jgi:putative two-component system response regulator
MARVLVIDDEPIIRDLIVEILADAGYELVSAENAEQGLDLLSDNGVDAVVSDIIMPGLTGLQLLEEVRRIRPSLPVVLVTGAGTHAMLADALAGGADGFVMKPFSHGELVHAVTRALEQSRRAQRELRERLLAPTLASAVANAIEAREATMRGHCERISQLAVRIAVELGLGEDEVETVRVGAVVHDVGKIGIPDSILLKSGSLTDDEQALMRTHPLIGDRILEPVELPTAVRCVVRHHHERWDGAGYPEGLAGEAIPLAARIVALADAVEAMSGERAYRLPLSTPQIVSELRDGRGAQWQPELVDIALDLIEREEIVFEPQGLVLRAAGSSSPEVPALTVLIVEHDTRDARVAKDALERSLGRVVVALASDAESALELCRGATWSLVVLDQQLPDGSALELVHSLRHLAPDVPVVMLTGEGSEHLAVEAFRHGVSDYVVKTDDFARELSGRVRTLVTT